MIFFMNENCQIVLYPFFFYVDLAQFLLFTPLVAFVLVKFDCYIQNSTKFLLVAYSLGLLTRPLIILTQRMTDGSKFTYVQLLWLIDLVPQLLFYYVVFQMVVMSIGLDYYGRETFTARSTLRASLNSRATQQVDSRNPTEAESAMNLKIKRVISKFRLFYILFVSMTVLVVVLKLIYRCKFGYRLQKVLLLVTMPLQVVCFALEIIVVSHFVRAGRKFVRFMS